MEIKDTTTDPISVLLTPAESKWAGSVMARAEQYDLARRIARARRQAVEPYVSRTLFDGLPELASDIDSRVAPLVGLRHLQAEIKMADIYSTYFVEADGSEKHVVAVEMTKEELERLRNVAQAEYAASRQLAMDFSSTLARLDEESVRLCVEEGLDIPTLTEDDKLLADEVAFTQAFRDSQVAAGIIATTQWLDGSSSAS